VKRNAIPENVVFALVNNPDFVIVGRNDIFDRVMRKLKNLVWILVINS